MAAQMSLARPLAPRASCRLVVAGCGRAPRWLAPAATTRPAAAVPPRLERVLQSCAASHSILRPSIQQRGAGQRQQRAWTISCGAVDGEQQSQQLVLSLSQQEPGTSDGTMAAPSQGGPDSAAASGSAVEDDSLDDSCSSDSESSTVKIDLQLPRRSMLVQFTCDKCTGRSERLVNPLAWNKGMVIAQCQHCEAWHMLSDAAGLVEEIRYADLEDD
ncbi:Mitochondrial protein import protein ZIM17 [Chlorella vulgaris]